MNREPHEKPEAFLEKKPEALSLEAMVADSSTRSNQQVSNAVEQGSTSATDFSKTDKGVG
jgi:hypothetical protein